MSKKLFQACIECKDRCIGCHSKCKKYIEDRAELDVRNEREKQIKSASRSINNWDFEKVVFWGSKRANKHSS